MSVTQRLKEALLCPQFWDSRLQHCLEFVRAVLTISRWVDEVAGGGPGRAGVCHSLFLSQIYQQLRVKCSRRLSVFCYEHLIYSFGFHDEASS